MRREKALVAQVVNCENHRSVPKIAVIFVEIAQIDRHERRLPVVAVDDVRRRRTTLHKFQCRQRESRITVSIVGVVFTVMLIQTIAIEVLRAIHEIGMDIVSAAAVFRRREFESGTQRQGQALRVHDQGAGLGHAIARQDHFQFMPEGGERLGQRAHDICQPAGLGIGHTFGCDEHNFHASSPFGERMSPNFVTLEDAPGKVKNSRSCYDALQAR